MMLQIRYVNAQIMKLLMHPRRIESVLKDGRYLSSNYPCSKEANFKNIFAVFTTENSRFALLPMEKKKIYEEKWDENIFPEDGSICARYCDDI